MKHLYEFQRYLAMHRRRHWRSRIGTAFVVLAALALAMIEQLGEMTSSKGDRLSVAARCLERCRFLAIFVSLAAYALTTTLVVAENAHDRAEQDLALGGARPALLPYLGMPTADLASHESLLAYRARLLGIAAGAGIVLGFEVGRAAVELQHG
jgi:hypothetical protein